MAKVTITKYNYPYFNMGSKNNYYHVKKEPNKTEYTKNYHQHAN